MLSIFFMNSPETGTDQFIQASASSPSRTRIQWSSHHHRAFCVFLAAFIFCLSFQVLAQGVSTGPLPARIAIQDIRPLADDKSDSEKLALGSSLAGALYIAMQSSRNKLFPIPRGEHWRGLLKLQMPLDPRELFTKDVLKHVEADWVFSGEYKQFDDSLIIFGGLQRVDRFGNAGPIKEVEAVVLQDNASDLLIGVTRLAKSILSSYSALAFERQDQDLKPKFVRVLVDCLLSDTASESRLGRRISESVGRRLEERFSGHKSVHIIDATYDQTCGAQSDGKGETQSSFIAHRAKYALEGTITREETGGKFSRIIMEPVIRARVADSNQIKVYRLPILSKADISTREFVQEATNYLEDFVQGIFDHIGVIEDQAFPWEVLSEKLETVDSQSRPAIFELAGDFEESGRDDLASLLFRHIVHSGALYEEAPELMPLAAYRLGSIKSRQGQRSEAIRHMYRSRKLASAYAPEKEKSAVYYVATRSLVELYLFDDLQRKAWPLMEDLVYHPALTDAVKAELSGKGNPSELWRDASVRESLISMMQFFNDFEARSEEEEKKVNNAFEVVLNIYEAFEKPAPQRRIYAQTLSERAIKERFFGNYDISLRLVDRAIEYQKPLPAFERTADPYFLRVSLAYASIQDKIISKNMRWPELKADRETLIEFAKSTFDLPADKRRRVLAGLDLAEAYFLDERWAETGDQLATLSEIIGDDPELQVEKALVRLYELLMLIAEGGGKGYLTPVQKFEQFLEQTEIPKLNWNFFHTTRFFSPTSGRLNYSRDQEKISISLIAMLQNAVSGK